MSIKKCRIEGYLCLFQAGFGRYSNNYTLWKETFFPEKYPGGGGWSIQRLSLANLYTQHKEYMNYWTKSNDRLNLCRFMGTRVTLFRQRFTDYIFTWMEEQPRHVHKYYYASYHPLRLMTHKRKKIVPSLTTQPHKKKPYKTLWIPPPKIMKNQWFFQQQLSGYALLTFAATACSLNNIFGSDKIQSNNCTLYCIDTSVFTSPYFQFKQQKPNWGYQITGQQFLWGIDSPSLTPSQYIWSNAIYLGNTMENIRGDHINQNNYKSFDSWGNPFHWTYLTQHLPLAQTQATKSPDQIQKTLTTTIQTTEIKQTPLIFTVRYNPFKDKGDGNRLYVVPNYLASKTNWDPPTDTDLVFENFPLWLMCWGFEDILKRIGKTTELDLNWTAVIQSKYLSQPEKYYVLVSHEFILGKGPYNTEHEDLSRDDITHWYPRWKYQRQAFNNITQTGPFVATGDNAQNIQASMKYQFYFKWGGNSPPQENIFDPVNQPITPYPHNLDWNNEIIDPSTSITTEIYPWDFRRDLLTTTATERITESSTYDFNLFTDGDPTTEQAKKTKATPQTEKTQKTQKETLFQQLQHIQQFNLQLQQRLLKLKQLSMDL